MEEIGRLTDIGRIIESIERKETPVFNAYDTGDNYVFYCPFCEKFHTHGRAEGHRAAHCAPRSIRYKNECVESPFRETGYILRYAGKLDPKMEKYLKRNYHNKPVSPDWDKLCRFPLEARLALFDRKR